MVRDTLKLIAEKLNSENIQWAVGASVLLNFHGLIEKPNDVDIFIDVKNIEKADLLLMELGIRKSQNGIDTYATKHFYEYVINEMDVDVMAGFIINFDGGSYKYVFDEKSITDINVIRGVKIPFTSLEDWYVIYQLIPNREPKVKLIEEYLKQNGIKNMYLIERALNCSMPEAVRNRILDFIEIK